MVGKGFVPPHLAPRIVLSLQCNVWLAARCAQRFASPLWREKVDACWRRARFGSSHDVNQEYAQHDNGVPLHTEMAWRSEFSA